MTPMHLLTCKNCEALKIEQSLGAAVLRKTSASSVTGGGTPGKYVECSESRRLFHRRGPVTVNERSPRLVQVLGTSHVATLDDRSRRRPAVEVSWQSSDTDQYRRVSADT